MLASFIDFREEEISITFTLVAAIFIGQQVYEGIAVQNNISNIAHIVGGIVGAIIVYGLNVKAKYGLYR
ncbi:MAG: rhomboid family intramembrane serine protease [Catenibacterium mitsuokai]|nr:rhomboid family intramembrane serine protease [Catenibacterium mitsuokai]MEE0334546.1 rhomboid family intramembrane serine protease [Catenibacterium mitsuokai]